MSYPDQIAESLQQAHTDLAKKLIALGRVIAPGAEIEYKYDVETNSFTLTVDTIYGIYDPELLTEKRGVGPYDA